MKTFTKEGGKMLYPISETFYSIIGEGEFTGCPAFFIRLAGCNLGCKFCDTDYQERFQATPGELLDLALKHPARKVVVTGGEPTIHKLKSLFGAFRGKFKIHLETNGSIVPDSMDMDWVTVSPKNSDVSPFLITYASEVKFLCGIPNWEEIINYYSPKFLGIKWLMPLADGKSLHWGNIQKAVRYCLNSPQVRFCLQVHKVIQAK